MIQSKDAGEPLSPHIIDEASLRDEQGTTELCIAPQTTTISNE